MLYNRAKFLQNSINDQKQYLRQRQINSKNKNKNQLTQQQLKNIKIKQQVSKGINHPRIREIIHQYKYPENLINQQEDKLQKKQQFKNNLINLKLLEQRKWLTKKGRKFLIDFDDNQRKQMKSCFNSMDVKGYGSIGIDQLEELLISVGLMESRQEVKILIDSVDQDKSGKIEFSEFLKMILNDQGENQQIVSFFKHIINSKKNKTINQKNNKENKNQSIQVNYNNNDKKKVSLITDQQNMMPLITQKAYIKQRRTVNVNYERIIRTKKLNQFNKPNNSTLQIFQKHPYPKNLPFGMVVSHIRRKHMMTALKINNETSNLLKNNNNRSQPNILSNTLRSNQNLKMHNKNNFHESEDVIKGQNVMNALKKMWDRRLLRQIRESKKMQKINQENRIR